MSPIHRFTISPRQPNDPRSLSYLHDAHALGLMALTSLLCQDLFFVEGSLSVSEQVRLAETLLCDPIAQQAFPATESGAAVIEVALHPGVTDSVAAQLVRAAHLLGFTGVGNAAAGLRFLVTGLDEAGLHLLARRLLANPTIHRYAIGAIEPIFPHPAQSSGTVSTLPVRGLDAAGLLELSTTRRAALDLAEMQAIQRYFAAEGRDPTDIEFETIAQTWSEHCGHKSFKAIIEIHQSSVECSTLNVQRVNGLLHTFIRSASEQIAAPWVRSMFVDNAGVIAFDDEFEISFKVETHNHPSAIEPFGGANTGVGGVIRDVLGVSARPIAATDVLCFGPQDLPFDDLPAGVLHPRRIQSGVTAGVQDYGNKIGIPTVNGAILYDPGYTANPLVFCGCVGIAPKGSHPRRPLPGDRIILLGGGAGRDGLRGATFSSMTMDAQTGEVAGASVQIGDPITEKGLIEVITRARDARLYHAVTDCGAGGLSSAVGEMAAETGAEVELARVPLKYAGLAPWEIWLSEAQERMVLAVPPENLAALQVICDTFEVALADIGVFSRDGRLAARYDGAPVLQLDAHWLHHGNPQRRLEAVVGQVPGIEPSQPQSAGGLDFGDHLLKLLAHPNTASKAAVIRRYDHEVQGGTVVKPLCGAGNDAPADACVLKPAGTKGTRGIVLSNGINPELGKRDAYRMALSAVDEAIRNAVAAGADPQRIALLDNFCWGDPLRPETLGALVEACRGCRDAALAYRTPFISGKDSLNNEYLGSDGQRHAIPPTLLISAIGIIEDVSGAVTMDLKAAGDVIYRVGAFERNSEFEIRNPNFGLRISDIACAPDVYRALHRAMTRRLASACHDLSEGGLAVAAAEMCIGGRLGMRIELNDGDAQTLLFAETDGCLLVEVRPADCAAFEAEFDGLPLQKIGVVVSEPVLTVVAPQTGGFALPVADLARAWQAETAAQS